MLVSLLAGKWVGDTHLGANRFLILAGMGSIRLIRMAILRNVVVPQPWLFDPEC